MKVWLFTMAGLAFFIIAACLVQSNLERTNRHLNVQLEKATSALQARQWSQSKQALKALDKDWERTRPWWAILLNHKEIDAIEQAMTRTQKAVESRDFGLAMVEIGTLKYFLDHIPERERFNPINMF